MSISIGNRPNAFVCLCVCDERWKEEEGEIKDQREQCGHILDRLMNGIQCIYI